MLKLNKHVTLILAILFILIIIPCSFAQDMENNTLSDDVNDVNIADVNDVIYVSDADSNGDGSQNSPFNSISDAVEKYNSSLNSYVYIKNGEYKINEEIELTKDITIIGQSSQATILDAQNQCSIFKLTTKSKIALVNLTLKNADGDAALFLDYGDNVIVDNCIFENNAKGAICHKSYFGDLVLNVTNSIFTNNYNKDGGAININRGALNVTNSIFKNNAAPTGDSDASQGGAIYAGGGTLKTVYIDNCVFINNSATHGSAISDSADSEFYVFNSIFTNNTSPGNSKYNLNSSVINAKPSLKGINLYLKNNTLSGNVLNNEIESTSLVKINYLDKNVKIAAEDLEKIYGDDYNYRVKLTDFSGNPLSGKEITVVLTNSKDETQTVLKNVTNSEGIALICLANQKPGKYSAFSKFDGDNEFDGINITNIVKIRTESSYNIIFTEDHVYLTEGDSYNATAYIYDEYMVPTTAADGASFSVDWFEGDIHRHIDVGSVKVVGNKLVYDINRCHLITTDIPYEITFEISNVGSAVLTVDLSKNISNIDKNLDTIYVSKTGNDETGDGSENNPLATVQNALIANTYLGGGKTIIVGEGTYEISTFNIIGNVTIIGDKSKTILKQTNGILGMFEIENKNTVNFINLTFINGYATPEPESLIHVTEESVAYFDGCEFYNNSAMDGSAIALSRGAKVYINNSYFHDNIAKLRTSDTYGIGGAIYVHDYSYLYVANSLFENNSAMDGGAIFLGFGSEADIINSTFIKNTALVSRIREGGGGAIYSRSSNLNIENSSFIENYADLCGGAIYIDYGDIEIYKSYFENNNVKSTGDYIKGSAIQSSYMSYCNITMHYSVLISEDVSDNYVVYICNLDENHTADTYYNYWKVMSPKTTAGSVYEIKIQVNIENEYIYTGDVVEFNVEFVNYNVENGTSPLNESVHDFALTLTPTIGVIENPNIVIKDNLAKFVYEATTVGSEAIKFENIFNHLTYRFNVLDGSDKLDLNHTIDVDINKTSTITVNFDNDVSGNVTIRVNDDDYSVAIADSKATLNVETLPGEYNIKVIYQGDDNYKGFISTKSFNVAKYASNIFVEDVTVFFNGKFQAILRDSEGNPISDEKLNININGTDYTATTDENGIATLNLNLASVGTYYAVTAFNGNSVYNSTQSNSTIAVVYTNIKLEASDIVINPANGSFVATITDDENNPIGNVDVKININGTEYNIKTDNNGQAILDLKDNGLDEGKYDVYVDVAASGVYGASNTSAVITVEKILATITAQDVTTFSNTGEVIATLKDSNGNAISDKIIIFELNGNSTEITTDENGQAVLELNLDPGNYTAVIKLKQDKIFDAKDTSAKIKVNLNTVIINAPDVVVYYSNGKFTVTLTDVEGNPINSEVIVSINGLNYFVTTNNGVGSINLNLPVGTYKAVTQFRGNNIFLANNFTSNITVLSSISSQDITRAYMSPYDFNATLVDSQGNPLVNESVNMIVNGDNYTAVTDSQGVLLFNQNLAVGRYAITVINPKTGEETSNYANIVKRLAGNSNINMYFGAGNYFKVLVYGDDGKVVGANEIVLIKVSGVTYKVKTDSKGYASLKINLKSAGSKSKTYTITATYKGVKVSNKIVVKPVLTAKNISKKKAKTIKFSAKLVNTKGKVVKGKKITFKIKNLQSKNQ